MSLEENTKTAGKATLVHTLAAQFAGLHERSRLLVERIPAERLYWQPRETPSGMLPVYSCGEHLLRSAAAVEQTAGGITTNLWDDPFEWTLPEMLSTKQRTAEYLDEVEQTRQGCFRLINSDAELAKEIGLPANNTKTLFALLAETLVRSAHHQGQAFAIFRLFSDERLPRV